MKPFHTRLSDCLLQAALLLPLAACSLADNVSVAVAANFTAPMKQIAADFEKTSGHTATLSFGSSGKFVAQISNGAPFEVFLSADQDKPGALQQQGLSVASSRFTYAEGSLALWSNKTGVDPQAMLTQGDYRKLAIANPRLAPYGAAALQVLEQLQLTSAATARLVQGDNIAQTWQFAASGNAELAFVALSQVTADGKISQGSAWVVPNHLHDPIKQDAVLLVQGQNNPAATALMSYLQSEAARAVIRSFGYQIPAP